MSIFTKILSPIITPLIRKEIKRVMEKFIGPIKELILGILERKKGTKFLATVAALGAIVYLHMQGHATATSDIVIGGVLAFYYLADILSKWNQCDCDMEDDQ